MKSHLISLYVTLIAASVRSEQPIKGYRYASEDVMESSETTIPVRSHRSIHESYYPGGGGGGGGGILHGYSDIDGYGGRSFIGGGGYNGIGYQGGFGGGISHLGGGGYQRGGGGYSGGGGLGGGSLHGGSLGFHPGFIGGGGLIGGGGGFGGYIGGAGGGFGGGHIGRGGAGIGGGYIGGGNIGVGGGHIGGGAVGIGGGGGYISGGGGHISGGGVGLGGGSRHISGGGGGLVGGGGLGIGGGLGGGGGLGIGGGLGGGGGLIGPISHGGEVVDKSVYSGGKKNLNDGSYEKANGESGVQVNQGHNGFEQGKVGVQSSEGNLGYYNDQKGGKNVVEDEKSYLGGQQFNKHGQNSDEKKQQAGHKKGHVIKGFKSSHHKDETGKTEEYYDEANDEGDNFNFHGQNGNYGEGSQASFKGGHDDRFFNADERKKQGHYDSGHYLNKDNADHGQYGQKKYTGNGQVYGVNNGIDQQSLLGHQEHNRFFKHHPYFH